MLDFKHPKKVFEYVLDIGTYTSLDFDFEEVVAKKVLDGWGACTAVAKKTKDGKLLIGRNMDLYISHKPAYIIRTDIKDEYKTIGLSYYHTNGPDYKEVMQKGIDDDLAKLLPFLCTDVFNEKGLYVETNMRSGEYWTTGKSIYGCKGTNPDAKRRICSAVLPRYICQNCATVDEALSLVKTMDMYTPKSNVLDWNFCFLLGDATGHFGILEIAEDRLSWLDYEPAQANFYLTKEFQLTERLPAGIGRYKLVIDNRDKVQNEKDMYELMKRVSYSKVYDPDNCEFDVRSEFITIDDYTTLDVMTSEELKDYVMEYLRAVCKKHRDKTRLEKQDAVDTWESAFTIVTNCTEKTMFIRFFEDEEKTIKIGF